MKKKRIAEISKRLVSDKNDYMFSFRSNIRLLLKEADISISQLSEEAELPFDTLKTFIYNDTKDCKLSTAIRLSRALGISIDELVGAETLTKEEREGIFACRNLPDTSKYLIRWFVENQRKIYESTPKGKRMLSVLKPICDSYGNFKSKGLYKDIDITNLSPELRSKVFFGMKIPNDKYMPLYGPYDVLLLCNDRPAKRNEHLVIENDNSVFVVTRRVENGVAKLYGLRDGLYRMDENDVDKVIGYVADVLKVDLEF